MNNPAGKRIGSFTGKFIILYLAAYVVVALLFLALQSRLPEEARIALDFFEPYQLEWTAIAAQVLIGAVIALVLYPFYDIIIENKRGLFVLFFTLWGITLVGSLEPKPGTIEGMLYTETSFFEHILVLAAGAIQFALFSRLLLFWERRSIGINDSDLINTAEKHYSNLSSRPGLRGYVIRFSVLHLLVYMIVGALFYEISGYEEALATMEEFTLWRDLENLVMPIVILVGQIFRGAILALFLSPFYPVYLKRNHGWALLFGLLFGLKALATVITVPETAAMFWTMLEESKTGLPEIIAQTLVFSLLFFAWERWKTKKAPPARSTQAL